MKSNQNWVRIVLAAIIAPAVPMAAFATVMWLSSGSVNWFPLVFIFGYLFFCVLGLPVMAILIERRTLKSCVVAGGTVTILPIVLLSLFSVPMMGSIYTFRMLFDLSILFGAGVLGGILFWIIAFAGFKGTARGSAATKAQGQVRQSDIGELP